MIPGVLGARKFGPENGLAWRRGGVFPPHPHPCPCPCHLSSPCCPAPSPPSLAGLASVSLQVTIQVVEDPQAEVEMDLLAEPSSRWPQGAPSCLPRSSSGPSSEATWRLRRRGPVSRAEPQGKRRPRRTTLLSTARASARWAVMRETMTRSLGSVGPQGAGSRAGWSLGTGPAGSRQLWCAPPSRPPEWKWG